MTTPIPPHRIRIVAFAVLAAIAASCAAAPPTAVVAAPKPADSKPSEVASPPLFSRVGLIGASATAGFGVRLVERRPDGSIEDIHAPDLGDILLASSAEPIVVSRHGSMFFFSDPLAIGRTEVDRVVRFKPTVVLGVDFLFWYGYGTANVRGESLRNEDERLELLEEGLRQADRVIALGVPVVLGDFPDMRGSVGHLLSAEQVPERATLARLNARVAEWASTRPNARILALSSLVPRLVGGETLTLRGRDWCCTADGTILQDDRLHPTLIGSMAMLTAACELAETCSKDGTCGTLVIEPNLSTQRILDRFRADRAPRRPIVQPPAPSRTSTVPAAAPSPTAPAATPASAPPAAPAATPASAPPAAPAAPPPPDAAPTSASLRDQNAVAA